MSISSMVYKNLLLKTIISIGENWLKKNHPEREYSSFFDSRNKNNKSKKYIN